MLGYKNRIKHSLRGMMGQGSVHNIAIFVLGSFFSEGRAFTQNITLKELEYFKGKDSTYSMSSLPIDETCTLYFLNPPENKGFFYTDIGVLRSEFNVSSIGYIVMVDFSKPQIFRIVQSLWYTAKAYWDAVIVLADTRNKFGKTTQDQSIEEMYQHVLGAKWGASTYPCDVKQQRYKALEVVSHLLDLMPDQPNIEAIQKKLRIEIEAGSQERAVQILLVEPYYPSEARVQVEDKEQPFQLPERIEIEAGYAIEFHKVPKDKWLKFEWMETFHLQYPNSLLGCIVLLTPLLSMTSPKVTEIVRHFESFSPYPCVFMGYLEDGYSFNRQIERLTRLSQADDEVVLIGDIHKPEDAKRAVKRLMDAFLKDELASSIKAKLA
ncbi:MAG: hypothetical protein DPW16_07635 [Chloroflexi bacterium]|nr:hypothetical protein [Chloroflexota bacterium]